MLKHVLDVIELLDRPQADGHSLAAHLRGVLDRATEEAGAPPRGAAPARPDITVSRVEGAKGGTDFVKVVVPGSAGARSGGSAPTLGILGRLGGVGARPERIGIVSDADGAVAALSAAAKLLDMHARGDVLPGDVILSTHVCPDAPTRPHDPVPFMDSPVSILDCNREEIDEAMDAVVSIDTTKGNRLLNHRGLALSPTVKEGWILRVSDDLLGLLETVTGEDARVLPITTQDITPYGNGVHHINSIMQPCVATSAPVVGLALTTRPAVAGCATGASHERDIAAAGRFAVETAKEYGRGVVRFHDPTEFARLVDRYGPMTHLQSTAGATDE
ncbi:DUF1177 domain-containing protein [Streptomyces smyrnaeus]|uniref:DUF1177 domain-containing protein n=1 Tax=Streptomyces TaxID=1883 RepID=UPI001B36D957|nr:DUF1177 domain-containing protein [Streptomyces sp. RK75]MBQ0864005.1 DUF1177 domain-containing protein [Streptomyces sp. RK75]MBQ1159429.1 DUF1177 domain-containing protein [Streptomyces sp. A73]